MYLSPDNILIVVSSFHTLHNRVLAPSLVIPVAKDVVVATLEKVNDINF